MNRIKGHGIGGGDVPSIFGIGFVSRYRLWCQKTGLLEKEPAGEPAYWGRQHEPNVLRHYARENECHVVARGEEWGSIRTFTPAGGMRTYTRRPSGSLGDLYDLLQGIAVHAEHGWMCGAIDAFACPKRWEPAAGLEAKTAGAYVRHDWKRGPRPSDVLQVQHYAEITASLGLDLPWFNPVLIGGNRYLCFEVEREAEWAEEYMVPIEREFYLSLLRGVPPQVDGAAIEALQALHPEADADEEIEVEPDVEIMDAVYVLADTRRAAAQAKKDGECATAAIMDYMGDAAKLKGKGWSIGWSGGGEKKKPDYKAALTEFRNQIGLQLEAGKEADYWPPRDILDALDEALAAHTTTTKTRRSFRPYLTHVRRPAALKPISSEGENDGTEKA